MAKSKEKTAEAKKNDGAEFGQPENCSEKCVTFMGCRADGTFIRSIKGSICPDFSPADGDEKGGDDTGIGDNTTPEPEKNEKETGTGTANTDNQSPKDGPVGTEATPPPRKRYVFPRQGDIKCPGCGLYETIAVSTRGAIQVRQCTRAVPTCRYTHETFKVEGMEVKVETPEEKSTDCKQGT